MLIDTHCHLDEYSEEELQLALQHMKDHIMIVSGVNDTTNEKVLHLCEQYSNIYGVVGIHPEEVDSIKENSFEKLVSYLKYPKIVGIGEIGLDYHYTKENIDLQKSIFKKQLDLAEQYHKPVVIHSREALQDTYDILKQYPNLKGSVVLHAYSGSLEMAREFSKLGVFFGVGGVVTFKNAGKIKEVVKEIPLDCFLLETDSPYLTPEPYRGKKNEPYYVHFVAEKIAEIKEIEIESVIETTTKTAKEIFSLPILSSKEV